MKKITFLATLLFAFTMNAQIFFDDFESYDDFAIDNVGDWILIDVDGLGTYSGGGGVFPNQFDPKAFMVFNPWAAGVSNAVLGQGGSAENRDFDPFSGDKYMGAWASSGGANNDWMISPAIELASSDNSLEVYVKSMSDTYGLEQYRIHIYEGSDEPAPEDFTLLESGTAPFGIWEAVTVDLDSYANQTVRIGIQCVSNDAYLFMVDDFKVDGSLSTEEVSIDGFTQFYSTQSKILTISATHAFSNISIYNVLGQEVIAKNLSSTNEVIDMSSLKDGVYIANVVANGKTSTFKVVKR